MKTGQASSGIAALLWMGIGLIALLLAQGIRRPGMVTNQDPGPAFFPILLGSLLLLAGFGGGSLPGARHGNRFRSQHSRGSPHRLKPTRRVADGFSIVGFRRWSPTPSSCLILDSCLPVASSGPGCSGYRAPAGGLPWPWEQVSPLPSTGSFPACSWFSFLSVVWVLSSRPNRVHNPGGPDTGLP